MSCNQCYFLQVREELTRSLNNTMLQNYKFDTEKTLAIDDMQMTVSKTLSVSFYHCQLKFSYNMNVQRSSYPFSLHRERGQDRGALLPQNILRKIILKKIWWYKVKLIFIRIGWWFHFQ